MRYDRESAGVEISLRELCSFAYRRGDLGGAKPRRRVADDEADQAAEPTPTAGNWHTHVRLKHTARMEGLLFSVSGRADRVLYDPDGQSCVELTALVYGDVQAQALYPEPELLARLCALGYFLCASKALQQVSLRLILRRAGGDETATSERVMTAEQLGELYAAMLEVIYPRAADLCDRQGRVRDALAEAAFPYPTMRDAQEDMIRECYRDLCWGETLFAQAPTGIGKTISTLYPALRALGKGHSDKIFYLTAKGAARREAFKAAGHLVRAGAPLRACVISAKESMCLMKEGQGRRPGETCPCDPALCPFARGYYDRVEGVIRKLLEEGNGLYAGLTIREAARAGRVCPYELSLDLSELCEVVICDYNYVFSPTSYLRRYFAPGAPEAKYTFLVDEAHNLPDRARDMYSGELSLAGLTATQEELARFESEGRETYLFPDEDAPRSDGLTAAALDDLVGVLSRMARLCDETAVTGADGVRRGAVLEREQPVELTETAERLARRVGRWLRRNRNHPLEPTVAGLNERLREYLTAATYYGSGYVTYVEVAGEDVTVRLLCLDPAPILRPLLARATARVLFSATLTPTSYFADVLGGGADSVTVEFPSPFPPENLCVSIADKLSTRYGDRDKSCRSVVNYIAATVSARRGNYLVYLPSYEYLDKVVGLFRKRYPKVDIVVQSRGMSAAGRDAFIASFKPDAERLHIGFCVLGGSFSEGVDLPGSCLIGTVIVGVGMPGLSSLRNIMKEYYDETREGEGYTYAYTYPGVNRVLQAAGRVIRTPTDRGVVVLLDDRWLEEPYRRMLPAHWEDVCAVGDPASLAERNGRFWNIPGADT